MTRKQKKLKRKLRGKVGGILDGDYEYHKAKDWAKRKASEHIYDYVKTGKLIYKNSLDQSIIDMRNYGHNPNIKFTKHGKLITEKDRKFYRVASDNMKRTLNHYKKTGYIPGYADMITGIRVPKR